MKTKDGVVYFKSIPEMYVKEKSGRKNNTVRLLTDSEHDIVQWTKLDKIEITEPVSGETIWRTRDDITTIGHLLGFWLVVFSWSQGANIR